MRIGATRGCQLLDFSAAESPPGMERVSYSSHDAHISSPACAGRPHSMGPSGRSGLLWVLTHQPPARQKESAATISLKLRVASFCQTPNCIPGAIEYVPEVEMSRNAGTFPNEGSYGKDWIEWLTKRTEPSQKPTLAPG